MSRALTVILLVVVGLFLASCNIKRRSVSHDAAPHLALLRVQPHG